MCAKPDIRRQVVAVVAWLIIQATCSAQENPLGLPIARDPQRPGALLLHGGGRITNDVFERFWQLAGGRDARIVLVPSAGYRRADYAGDSAYLSALGSRYGSWVNLKSQGWVKSFQFLTTDNTTDADDPRFVRALEEATGVWFSGGYQSRLNYRYVGEFPRQTLFQQKLREVVERGGVVGGTSAGLAALPEVMTLYEYRETNGAPAEAVAAHGLGLLSGAIVEQHFDARGGRLERFTNLLRDDAKLDHLAQRRGAGERMIGIAVEEKGATILSGTRIECLGGADTHLFLKNDRGRTLVWSRLSPGDTAQLRRDVPGTVLRREELQIQR